MRDDQPNTQTAPDANPVHRPSVWWSGWLLPSALALIVPLTSLAVASIHLGLVPPYLLLIASILFLPDRSRRRTARSTAGKASSVGEASSAILVEDGSSPSTPRVAAAGGVADRSPGSLSDLMVEAKPTRTRRGRGRGKKGWNDQGGSSEPTWVRIGPGKFVRVEGPDDTDPGAVAPISVEPVSPEPDIVPDSVECVESDTASLRAESQGDQSADLMANSPEPSGAIEVDPAPSAISTMVEEGGRFEPMSMIVEPLSVDVASPMGDIVPGHHEDTTDARADASVLGVVQEPSVDLVGWGVPAASMTEAIGISPSVWSTEWTAGPGSVGPEAEEVGDDPPGDREDGDAGAFGGSEEPEPGCEPEGVADVDEGGADVGPIPSVTGRHADEAVERVEPEERCPEASPARLSHKRPRSAFARLVHTRSSRGGQRGARTRPRPMLAHTSPRERSPAGPGALRFDRDRRGGRRAFPPSRTSQPRAPPGRLRPWGVDVRSTLPPAIPSPE